MPADAAVRPQSAGWKGALAVGLYKTGAHRALCNLGRYCEFANDGSGRSRFRRVRQSRYLILSYHRIGTSGAPLYSTLPQAVFAEQMRFLKRHYRVLSVRQMVEELQDSSRRAQAVVVTFDDGYAGTYTHAFPVLQAYKIPATVYLTGEAIETGELAWYDRIFLQFQRSETGLVLDLDVPHRFILNGMDTRLQAAEMVITYLRTLADEDRQQWCARFDRLVPLDDHAVRGAMLTWDDIHTMRRAGITFGAHTMTHPVVSRLRPDRLYEEIARSKTLIEERLDTAVDQFAFPFGKARDCGTTAPELLSKLGFTTAVTTMVGLNRPGDSLHRLKRMVIDNNLSIPRFALNIHRMFFSCWNEEATAS